MKEIILKVEKLVMSVMNISRFFKFKSGDENETAIMGIIDLLFEKILGDGE